MTDTREQEFFVLLSPDVQAVLADSQVTLEELLLRNGLNVRQQIGSSSIVQTDSGLKEPVTILIASSAVIASLTPVLMKAIEALAFRPVQAARETTELVTDKEGNPIRDASGNPLLRTTKEPVLLTPTGTQEKSSVSVQVPLIRLGFSSESSRG